MTPADIGLDGIAVYILESIESSGEFEQLLSV